MKNDYLTEEQAAEYSGFTTSTLRNWRSKKIGFPYVKSGTGFIRYSKKDIDDYMENNKVMPKNEN